MGWLLRKGFPDFLGKGAVRGDVQSGEPGCFRFGFAALGGAGLAGKIPHGLAFFGRECGDLVDERLGGEERKVGVGDRFALEDRGQFEGVYGADEPHARIIRRGPDGLVHESPALFEGLEFLGAQRQVTAAQRPRAAEVYAGELVAGICGEGRVEGCDEG